MHTHTYLHTHILAHTHTTHTHTTHTTHTYTHAHINAHTYTHTHTHYALPGQSDLGSMEVPCSKAGGPHQHPDPPSCWHPTETVSQGAGTSTTMTLPYITMTSLLYQGDFMLAVLICMYHQHLYICLQHQVHAHNQVFYTGIYECF